MVMDRSAIVTDQADEGQSNGELKPCCLAAEVKTQSRAAF